MDLIQKICQEPSIKALRLTSKSSLSLLQLVHDLQSGGAFLATLENNAGKRLQIITRGQDSSADVWKSIKAAYEAQGLGVQTKTLQKTYDLAVNRRVFTENDSVSSMGLGEHDTIQFKRKTKPKYGKD